MINLIQAMCKRIQFYTEREIDMKKIISIVLASMMLLTAVPSMAYRDNDSDIMNLLSGLDIMVGDDDGNFRLDDYVSRAEFAKIAVASSRSKNTVASGLKISPFKDVPYKHWAAPYVRAAVSAGIAEGYVDATFKPDDTVSYEEALTMVLKVLGYTNDDFGYSWPYGQIGLAENLDLTDNVNASQGEMLTRRQVANLIYNTLNTKIKDSQSKLISVFDCEVIEDVTIIASHNEDSSLAEDKIFTTAGTYEIDDNFNFDYVGSKGDIFIKNGNDFVAFAPGDKDNGSFEKYVIYSQLPNAVIGYKNGSFTQIDITDGTACYKDSARTSYAAVKGEMEMGDILYVKKDGNAVDYVTYEKGNMEGPVKVTGSNWMLSFDTNSSTAVMRNGNKVTASDIQTNDIIYYSAELNMVLAYTDKVTGVYEKASPTKDSPISVTVSGRDYSVESVEAFNDLSSSGSFKYGDTITILLGRTGEIAGVAGGTVSAGGSGSGFVIEAGKKDFTNADNTVYSSYYAKVVTPDGNIHEYAVNNNSSSLVCSAVRMTFKDGKASLTTIRNNGGVYGKVNVAKGQIGDTEFAEDVKILDTSGTYSDDTPGYCRIYPQRLDGMTLSSSSVLYYSKNGAGEIDELILKDVTGDTYSYGIITKRDKATGAYTIDIDGNQNTYMTGFSSSATGPHRFKIGSTGIDSMQQLVAHSSGISELTRTEAIIGQQKYLLSDKVVVYHRTDASTYMKIPLDDAINGNYRLTAYYDKAQTSGGRIRIIIAQDK